MVKRKLGRKGIAALVQARLPAHMLRYGMAGLIALQRQNYRRSILVLHLAPSQPSSALRYLQQGFLERRVQVHQEYRILVGC
jgi:hypothetical protein